MEQLASQVRELRTSLPARPFKDASLKVTCIGNCAVNKMSMLLKMQPGTDTIFYSNLKNWGNYDRDSFLERAEEADVIIGMSTATNENLFHTPDELRGMFGDKCIFVPLMWIDGMDSLQLFSITGTTRFFGGDAVVDHAAEVGFDQALTDMIRGDFKTDPKGRFAASIEKMKRAETGAIPMSDFILDTYQSEPVSNAIGHPTNIVMREMFCRVAAMMGLKINEETLFTPAVMGRLTLPGTRRVFSPYDVDDLGLSFPHDPDWMLQANSLFSLISNKVRKRSYLASDA